MTTFLVTHQGLLDQPQRLRNWHASLAENGIEFAAQLLLEQPNWSAPVARGDLLLALGGDGTQSAVAAVCLRKGAKLAVLPAGTGNDFARALGIPLGTGACALVARGNTRLIDVGVINGRPFLNVAHVGLGAQVGLKIPRDIKRRWGPLSYLRHLLSLLWRKRGFWGRIDYDGHSLYGRWLEVAIANGPSFGGGHQIGAASLNNGSLTLVCARARPLPRLLLAWLAARLGRPLDRKVLRFEHVRQCRLETHRRLRISADGEPVGHTPLQCHIHAASLQVISPR